MNRLRTTTKMARADNLSDVARSLLGIARGLSISLLASDALLYGGLMNVNIPRPQYGAIYCS